MASVAAEFRARCEHIAQTDDAGSGSLAHIEPALVELVEFSRAALSTNRSELVGSFCALIRDPTMPDELLLFTMHMLRFPEVLDAARVWAAEATPGTRAHIDRALFCTDLEHAYRDDWEDAVLWPSLAK